MSARILVVDDNLDILANVRDYLSLRPGWSVETSPTGGDALARLGASPFDLLILDIGLPDTDGITVTKTLRESGSRLPILMLTARDTVDDRVDGLMSGADDYLVKPFGMLEMVSRVKAVLRRSLPREQAPLLRCGEIAVDRARHLVTVQNAAVSLTLKEFELLCLFMENPGLVFTRDQLLRSVWGAEFVGESRTVDVHIGTLRTKLGQAGKYIATVRGVGYKLERES